MNGLSKRLVSLTMATAMVFSLTAVPATEASAATKTITAKTTSIQAGQTYTYSINAKKAKNVKISVSGAAKSGVTATVNGKKLSGKTLKGGKTLKVKIKANTKVVGKKFVVNYKLDKKATKKTKAIKVNYSAKSVSLDQTALTLEAGKTATLKATINPTTSNSTIKSWVSSDEKVATVNNGVVTAVAAGTADITVTTSNGKTAKATVTVEEKKEEVKDTVPQMTALTATAADTLKATFASAVPANEAITITRSKSTAGFTGIATWNADRTELTYKLDTNLVEDVYTMTVKVGESSTSLTYEATARKATTIEILGDTALTNNDKKEAYVYYDVKDQYGESVRTSTSVSITSSTGKEAVSRSTGKITVKPADFTTPFKFGDIISVTIVDTKNGLSQSKVLNVGLEQNADAVTVAGFVNKDEPTKLLDRLPKNFARNKYYVLYQAKDQQGNILDNDSSRLGFGGADKLLTVTVSDPMLIKPEFSDDGTTFTVDGVTYDSFMVEPGQYSDKGGETVLTIISNKTGTKTAYTAIVEDAGILKSLVLNAPSATFADGEDTKLTYAAKDTKDNDITSFEAIVRSTNKLNITASVGTLTLYEGNDGEAVIKYADSMGSRSLDDGIDQPVVLTTVVVGGETNNMQFGISDYAYPVAFKEINTDRKTNTIVVGGSETIDFADLNQDGSVQYIDQYGRTFASNNNVFWRMQYLNGSTDFHTGLAIVMDVAGVTSGNSIDVFNLDEKVIVPGVDDSKVSIASSTAGNNSVRFYIGATDYNKKNEKTFAKLNAAGPMKTVTYTCVPYAKVKNIAIESIKTLQVKDDYSGYANLADYKAKTDLEPVSGNSVLSTTVENSRYVTVAGTANNEKVYIPKTDWVVQDLDDTTIRIGVDGDGKISTVTGLKLSDLYKTATATGDRSLKDVTLQVKVTPTGDVVETTVSISDAPRTATTIKFYDGWKTELKDKAVVDPSSMSIVLGSDWNWKDGSGNSVENLKFGTDNLDWKDYLVIKVFDQYEDQIACSDLDKAKISISKLAENTGELAHKSNSLTVANNNTRNTSITGAEIKDAFTFTISLGNAKASIDVTVGGDQDAKASTATGLNTDENFRKVTLGYTDR